MYKAEAVNGDKLESGATIGIPSVAKVSAKGRITAVRPGTAVIYVQTINGIWKTCTVHVR